MCTFFIENTSSTPFFDSEEVTAPNRKSVSCVQFSFVGDGVGLLRDRLYGWSRIDEHGILMLHQTGDTGSQPGVLCSTTNIGVEELIAIVTNTNCVAYERVASSSSAPGGLTNVKPGQVLVDATSGALPFSSDEAGKSTSQEIVATH